MKAKELIQKNEKAIVLFTRGPHFRILENGQAESGNWRLNTQRKFNKVVIYRRAGRAEDAEVFVGDYLETIPSEEENRSVVVFDNVKNLGTTDFTWKEFCGGSQNPVRYLG